MPADLAAEVLAGHADSARAGRTQDINIQVVPLLDRGTRGGRESRGQRRASRYARRSNCAQLGCRDWCPLIRTVDPMRHQALAVGDLRKALCMGGVFAVSTVLPEKIQRLAYHLGTINRSGTDGVLDHGLQVLGCFLVLSVLIWASKSEQHPVRPLLAYPPHNSETVAVHIAGLVFGVVLMLR